MFVVFAVHLREKESPKYERIKEFKTLEEANNFMKEQQTTDSISYTIMME